MAKKIFARARLVKGTRWHIDFTTFDVVTGTERRQRKDFDLNDIEDLTIREAVAVRILDNIETFASAAPVKSAQDRPTVRQAVTVAMEIKGNLPRKSSRRKYPTVARHFLAWCNRGHLDLLPADEFTRRYALQYWDYFTGSKKLRGRTINNYLASLRAIWSVMIDRELVKENPWTRVKPARKEEKLRRMFTDDERRVVATWAEQHDYWMFRGILLQFFCYIRPSELVALKFRDFDLSKGTVTVQEGTAKMWRKSVKTIPQSVLHYFRDGRFDKYPANYYVFGRVGEGKGCHMAPGAHQINENRPAKRHQRLLLRLKNMGLLGDIAGLSWYSWKDTGISLHARGTSPLATRDQAGHTDFKMTLVYYHGQDVNEEYRILANDLL